MSESLLTKSSVALHTIAITLSLAVISGQLPLKTAPFNQVQSTLSSQLLLKFNPQP